jgi:(p)ppGpp synthase/HD superfamily hydrolase
VGLLLAEAGCEPDVIAAGLLHDTVEDTPTTLGELCQVFGERIAEIVEGCTEVDKSLPWETRKEQALRALAGASRQVRLVQCADKLHNVRSMLRDLEQEGEALWSRFKRGREAQAWHYGRILRALRSPHKSPQESDLYGQLVVAVHALFGPVTS